MFEILLVQKVISSMYTDHYKRVDSVVKRSSDKLQLYVKCLL